MTQQPADDAPAPAPEPVDRPQLSLAQVAGSSAAAVSAAVLCSFFGVAGTIIGTAAASILATIGSALYAYSVRRTQARLRRLRAVGLVPTPVTVALATRLGRRDMLRRIPWRIVALGTANVFVFAIGVITGIEGILGQPIASELGVSHHGTGTSLGSGLGIQRHRSHHSPKPHSTQSPSPSPAPSTPTPTPTTSSPPASPSVPVTPPTLLPTASDTAGAPTSGTSASQTPPP